MSIPITGALALILGIGLFLFRPRLLYPATIIAIPFTATAIVNFGWANAAGSWGRSLEAWQFFFVLWVSREALSGRPPWHRAEWFTTRSARKGLCAFLGVAFLSLSVPLVMNGTTWVLSPRPITDEMIPLRLTSYDFTQLGYLAFGLIFAALIAAENSTPRKLYQTLRIYIASCTFAAAWGLLELWCELTSHAYPAGIFNTSTNIAAGGYEETDVVGSFGNIGRLSSVSQEPSVLARLLLYAFVALIVCAALRKPVFHRKWDLAAALLLATTLLASTSSTAYFGIVIALLVAILALYRMGQPVKVYAVITVGIVAAGVLVAKLVPLVNSVLTLFVLNKYQTGSGTIRMHSVAIAINAFLSHPLLGMGWHNVNSYDLLFLILANTGLIGLIAFASFVFPVLRSLWLAARNRKAAAVVFLPVFLLAIFLAEATSPTYVAGFFWLALGLGAGAAVAAKFEPPLEIAKRAKEGTAQIFRAGHKRISRHRTIRPLPLQNG